MTNNNIDLTSVNIPDEQQRLMTTARTAHARRAGRTLYHGDGLRQTMVALLNGTELAEHESPLEAFLHVLQGEVVIRGDNRHWQIEAGELLPVPPERHSVTALEDSVITLTVLRDVTVHRS